MDSVARVSDKEVELRLSAPLYDGEYVLTASNVTDTAVEKNALTESYPFTVTGVPHTVAAFFSDNILWIAVGALQFAAVIIFVVATTATIGAGRHRLERRGANCLHGRSYHHYGGHTPDRR